MTKTTTWAFTEREIKRAADLLTPEQRMRHASVRCQPDPCTTARGVVRHVSEEAIAHRNTILFRGVCALDVVRTCRTIRSI